MEHRRPSDAAVGRRPRTPAARQGEHVPRRAVFVPQAIAELGIVDNVNAAAR